VRIRKDSLIHRHQFATVMSRRGNDDLIGWIIVKSSRQIACIGSDVWGEIQKSHARIGKSSMEPLFGWKGQSKATSLNQFGYFPA
jgi:hypothetical protein